MSLFDLRFADGDNDNLSLDDVSWKEIDCVKEGLEPSVGNDRVLTVDGGKDAPQKRVRERTRLRVHGGRGHRQRRTGHHGHGGPRLGHDHRRRPLQRRRDDVDDGVSRNVSRRL